MNKLIEVSNLTYHVNDQVFFNNLSFSINENELVAIIGPNGSGKTSLVKIILGFIKNYKGSIDFHVKKFFGYVPQFFTYNPHIKINVRQFLNLTDHNSILTLEKIINLTNIGTLLDVNFAGLSGGQLRKVLLAKSLIFAKYAIFLDEPTCWLDKTSQEEFYSLIKHIKELTKMAIIVISHDPILLNEDFNQIIKLEREHLCFNQSHLTQYKN